MWQKKFNFAFKNVFSGILIFAVLLLSTTSQNSNVHAYLHADHAVTHTHEEQKVEASDHDASSPEHQKTCATCDFCRIQNHFAAPFISFFNPPLSVNWQSETLSPRFIAIYHFLPTTALPSRAPPM